jgi:DNA-binding FrmR family transcriptional regulator
VRQTTGHSNGRKKGRIDGYAANKDTVIKRLHRVEGQTRGLAGMAGMAGSGASCIGILTQTSATTRALQAVALSLLGDHLSHCVADAVAAGGDETSAKVAEVPEAIRRLVRT